MKRKVVILVVILICSFILDIAFGSVNFKASQIFNALMGHGDDITRAIIVNYRIPKALTAILAGASLSVSGVLMQTLFRNPLAGPDVLGVTSGASLGVAILTLGAGFLPAFMLGSYGQVIFAVIGAAVIMLLVIFVAMHVSHSVTLLIIGLMFGYFTGAIVSILQSMANPHILKLFITWTFGSLSSVGWNSIAIMSTVILVGLIGSIFLQKRLDTLILGDNYATSMGTDIKKTRIIIIAVTAVLTGTCTAFTGPIAFIGITVPHLTRMLLRTETHRQVLPASILCGAIIMLLCDVISQLPSNSIILPINSVTALFGAPIIIWIILKK